MDSSKIVRTKMGDKPYYVYELCYPEGFIDEDGTNLSNVIFYVGKGSNGVSFIERIDQHEHDALHGTRANEVKNAVIQGIWSKRMAVQKRIIFETDSEQEALAYEAEYIKQHLGPYLTNKVYPHQFASASPTSVESHPVFVLTQSMLDKWIYE